MKKLILPVVAMLLCMTACKKEENGILRLEVEHYNSDAKMHLGDNDFAVWDNNDAVYLNGQATAVSISGTTATIAVPEGVSAPYYASYPYNTTHVDGTSDYTITLPAVQTYRKNTAGQQIVDAPMAAYSTDGQKLKFRNIGSVLALEVKPSSTIKVTNIEVSANQPLRGNITFHDDLNSDPYTLSSCTNGGNTVTLMGINENVSTSGKIYYIALPAVNDAKFTIKVYTQESNFYYSYTRTQSGTVSFDKNTIHAVPLTLSNATRTSVDLFTINGSNQKVSFASGNVRYYNYYGTGWTMYGDSWRSVATSDLDANNCDLFGWSSDGNYGKTIYNSSYTGSTSTSTFKDWGEAVVSNFGEGYRTLSSDEWLYVFNTRTNNTVTFNGENKGRLRWRRATVAEVPGVILFPDGDVTINVLGKSLSTSNDYSASSFTADEWNKSFKPVGCVFLPALGYRSASGTITNRNTHCLYWSSTPSSSTSNNVNVLYVSNDPSYGASQTTKSRGYGLPVRLVKNRN